MGLKILYSVSLKGISLLSGEPVPQKPAKSVRREAQLRGWKTYMKIGCPDS